MAEEKRRRRRRQQRTHAGEPTYVRKLTAYLDQVRAWEKVPRLVKMLKEADKAIEDAAAGGKDAWSVEIQKKRADLDTAFGGIFGPDGPLEIGPQGFLDFRPPEVCWLWKGNTANGRPRMRVDGKLVFVTRWTFAKVYGPPPPGTVVMQRCGESRCVRASHLILMPRNAPLQTAGEERRDAT